MTTVVKSFLDAVLRAGACLRVLLIPCYVPDVVHYEMEGSMAQPFQEFVRMRDELRIKDLYRPGAQYGLHRRRVGGRLQLRGDVEELAARC